MSFLKINEEEFLGKQELNRMLKFLSSDGYVADFLRQTYSYGIVRAKSDTLFENFKIVVGDNVGTVALAADSYAFDLDGNIIFKSEENNILLPDDNQWYWISIEHSYSPIEVGTVSIDTSGNLTGVGTKFTEVLRGTPNFPSVIKFYGTSLNPLKYQVTTVVDDENAQLSGVFQNETNLQYSVIGTFTPSVVVPSPSEEIFQYDSCLLDFTQSITMPVLAPQDVNRIFFIARVKRNGSSIFIEDKRNDFWKLKSEYNIQFVDRTATNPLIGVESVKFENSFDTRECNQVIVGWGFRSTNWTINSELRRITLSGGEGGIFKDTSFFTDGDFNGWRLYAQDGSYRIILESTKVLTQVNLILDVLDPDDYTANDELIIVPDVEEIQIAAYHDGNEDEIEQIKNKYTFPISTGWSKMFLLVPNDTSYLYNVQYRYKVFGDYTPWRAIPSDTIGFYDESSFDSNGILNSNPIDRNRVPYITHSTNGFILLTTDPSSYSDVIARIDLGDILGVEHQTINPGSPLVDLVVGQNRQHQVLEAGGPVVLSADYFINLNKLDVNGDPCKNGNRFYIQIKAPINLNGNIFRIVTDFVNPATFTEIKNLTSAYINFANTSEHGLFFIATYDGTIASGGTDTWVLSEVNEVDIPIIQSEWTDMTLSNLKGYNNNSLTLTQPIEPLITIGKLAGTPCYFRYKQNGKTVMCNFAFEINWNVANVINNFRIALLAPLDSIRQPSVNAYHNEHNSPSQFPSGVFEMYAKQESPGVVWIYFKAESQIDMRSSGAFFGHHYSIVDSSNNAQTVVSGGDTVMSLTSALGSGNMRSVFSGQLTFELV